MSEKREPYEGKRALVVFPGCEYAFSSGGMPDPTTLYLDNPLNVRQFGKLCSLALDGSLSNLPQFKIPSAEELKAAIEEIESGKRPAITPEMAVIMGNVSQAMKGVMEELVPECETFFLQGE